MRIVAFSDIHGNQYAFRAFIEQIGGLEYDAVFFCGDIHGYYYGQEEVVRCMKQMDNLYAVMGNHDKLAVNIAEGRKQAEDYYDCFGHSYAMLSDECIEYVKGLPPIIELKRDGVKLAIMHGTICDRLTGRIYPNEKIYDDDLYRKYNYVFCGHTHFQMIRQCGPCMIVNAGSLGQPRDGMGSCFAYVDTVKGTAEYRKIVYDMRPLEAEVRQYDPFNKKMIEILHRGEQ